MTKTTKKDILRDNLELASKMFGNDESQLCFRDRLDQVKHPACRTPEAIDDLIGYSSAIKTVEEEGVVTLCLIGLIQGLTSEDQKILARYIELRYSWKSFQEHTPRHRLRCLADVLTV